MFWGRPSVCPCSILIKIKAQSAVEIFMQKQNLVILGSTGSIGHSTLSVIEHNPDKYHTFALVGGKKC